ncbi:MAG: hypothetical protein QM324_04015 [Bacteroidota bacterium]|jgi:mRNA-degrading endonuclease RelE of RelBE toxin-antitoxin system|nr:hypothetical protein [Bacteroidota bacterium]
MRVEYSKDFVKSVRGMSGKTLRSIRETIQEVMDARSPDQILNCRKLFSFKNVYRIRIEDYRAFFTLLVQIDRDTVLFEYLVPRGMAYSKGMISKLRRKNS